MRAEPCSYDDDSQRTGSSGSSDDSYSYVPNGNENSTGFTAGAGNEMTNSPGVTYTYDNNGNLITTKTCGFTTTYTYDYENRLTNVEIDGTMAATYTYDALGRRIGIDDSGTQTWTVYNGRSADANPYANFNSSGTLKMRYLDGLAVDELFARTDSSGNTAWYLTDQVGSVVAIASTSAVLDQITYDPFGNIVTQTDASEADRFLFAGMEYDSSTGLYYDCARYYDAAIGRFVSQDPKGFAAGDTNLYRYVANDPANASDPSGMEPPWYWPFPAKEGLKRIGSGYWWIAGPVNNSGHHAWSTTQFGMYGIPGLPTVAATLGNGRELLPWNWHGWDSVGDIFANSVGATVGELGALSGPGTIILSLPEKFPIGDYIWGTHKTNANPDQGSRGKNVGPSAD